MITPPVTVSHDFNFLSETSDTEQAFTEPEIEEWPEIFFEGTFGEEIREVKLYRLLNYSFDIFGAWGDISDLENLFERGDYCFAIDYYNLLRLAHLNNKPKSIIKYIARMAYIFLSSRKNRTVAMSYWIIIFRSIMELLKHF